MATKKIEVSVQFMEMVLECGTTSDVEWVDATAYNAFNILKENNIKPYCQYESYDDFINNKGE